MNNNWRIMRVGNDLVETIIKVYYGRYYHAMEILNRYARMKGMKFKQDDSLFGGYWVDYDNSDHPCYWIQ